MRNKGGAWWRVCLLALCIVPVSVQGGSAEEADVRRADLVWSDAEAGGNAIWFSSWQAGSWETPVRITDDQVLNLHPQVDGGNDGRRFMAWTGVREGVFGLRYSVQENGVWSAPQSVDTGLSSNIAPSVLVDGDGTPWMVWAGNDGGLDDVYFSRLVDAVWQEARRLHPANNVPDILPQLGYDGAGRLQVTWQSFQEGAYRSFASFWDGSGWSTPELVTAEASGGEEQDAASAGMPDLPAEVANSRMSFLRMYMAPTGR